MMVKKKQLNAEKHTTKNLLSSLEALKVEYERMKRERSDKAQSANGRARKEEDDAMVVTPQARVDKCSTFICDYS